MEDRDLVDEQMKIVNERIEVIEGAFTGTVVGLLVLIVSAICILF